MTTQTRTEIQKAFANLEIPIIADKNLIKSAWKRKVVNFHPDKAKNETERKKFHELFLKYTYYRDLCLDYAENIDEYNSFAKANTVAYEETEPTINNQTELEWQAFVRDKNAYFNFIDASLSSIESFLRLLIFSIVFAVGASLLLLLGIIALLGMFTSHIELPFTAWIGGFIFFVWLFLFLKDYNKKIERYTLDSLSKTGYPYRSFLVIWGFINFIFLILFWIYGKNILYAQVFGNLGFWFVFHNLNSKLYEIEEALEKIRKELE